MKIEVRLFRLPPQCKGDPCFFGTSCSVECWFYYRRFETAYRFNRQGLISPRNGEAYQSSSWTD